MENTTLISAAVEIEKMAQQIVKTAKLGIEDEMAREFIQHRLTSIRAMVAVIASEVK